MPRSAITGSVESILKAALSIAAALLPASSVQALELTLTAVPSPLVVFDCTRSEPLSGNACTPATCKPVKPSVALKRLTTSFLYQPSLHDALPISRSAITGSVESILKAALSIAAALLPASSVQALELTLTAVPSPLVVFDCTRSEPLSGKAVRHAAFRPDKPSVALKRLTTSFLYQPAGFGLDVGPRSAITGSVESILKAALSIAAALLPASSVQALELTLTAVPSPLVVFDCTRSEPLSGKAVRHAAVRPDEAYVALKRLTTSFLNQPAGFGLDVGPRSAITGSVESILKAALSIAAALLPASSVQALELTLTAVPSPLVVFDCTRSEPLSGKAVRHAAFRPDKPSVALKRLTTSFLYQPAGFGLDVGPKSLITGSVESILKAALSIAAALLPA